MKPTLLSQVKSINQSIYLPKKRNFIPLLCYLWKLWNFQCSKSLILLRWPYTQYCSQLLNPLRTILSQDQLLWESISLQTFHYVSFSLTFSNFSPLAFVFHSLLPFSIPPDPSYHFTAPMFIAYSILSLCLVLCPVAVECAAPQGSFL